ncbi:MAG: ABC transporter ATP-binding protein [Nitrososphaerales archaeon]
MTLSVLALTILRVYVPVLLGEAVGDIVAGTRITPVLIISFEIIVISSVSAIFQFALGYGGQSLGQKMIYDMRNAIFSKIQSQSFSFHDRNETGELMARATGDVEAVRRFLAFGSAQILGNIFLVIGVVVSIFLINFELALIVAAPLPLIGYISWRYSQTQAPHWKKAREHYGAMNSALQQNILGMKVVRAFSAEREETRKFELTNRAYRDDIVNAAAIRAFYSPLLILILNLSLAAVYVAGGSQVINSGLSIDSIIAAANLIALLIGPVRFLGMLILLTQNGMAGFERVLEITDSSVEVKDKDDALEPEKIEGNISFRNVSFHYGDERSILAGMNLEIRAGESVAFVGATGSGKTTAANLIPRFYDPTSGRVLIDGVDVKDLKLKYLRSNVGIVSQDIFLFSARIRDNIAYGAPNTSTQKIIEASEVAHADEFIERFPEKYETLVGERGVTLSGGQKQRVAIARTLITDPKILIFDDSLSSVDVETEHSIQDSLEAVLKNRTTIIITQRLSTLRLAKRIVVFSDGKIVEEGTHADLLARGGMYAGLYSSQLAPAAQQRRNPK